MPGDPIHYQSLVEISAAIADGSVTSLGVTESILDRINTQQPRLFAYISINEQQALERAAELDRLRQQGTILGPLHGVPIAVKDLCHQRGTVTTGGHSFRQGMVSKMDATVVARLEAAGAVLVGKLATTEGAMVGYHPDFAVPRNPWAADRGPGFSSSGSGVATAAGLCFGSLGTDTGGSIRFPSAVNGIVGLKPTWGRVSRHGVLDLAPTLDHVGPMARSVKDAARMLGVIAGQDPNDPTSLWEPTANYESDIHQGVRGLRIGWDEVYATENVDSCVADAMRQALKQLAEAGAIIVNVEVPDFAEEDQAWMTIAAAEAAAIHESTFPARESEYGHFFREFLTMGNALTSVDLSKAIFQRRHAIGRAAPIFSNIDCLLCPTLAGVAYQYEPSEAYSGIDPETGRFSGVGFYWIARNKSITVWDYSGYPTLSVPCGFSPERLPISLQIIGKPLSESILCRVGYAYEQANEFHRQHPTDEWT